MTSIPDQELEYHYSPSQWSHRMSPNEVIADHLDAQAQGSKHSLWTLDCETEISYGDSERQKLDIFDKRNSSKKGAPIMVYFHGGYWQVKELGREVSSCLAVPLCNAGATVVVVGYDLTPDVTLDTIIQQIKKAIYYVIDLAKERESKGIYLSGHSAGGHLAAMMLMSSFSDFDPFDCELIKGAMLVSGVYDLRPLTKTSNNVALKLTEEDAWRLSPQNFVKEIAQQSQHRHIVLAVGEYDPPEFRRQSGEMEKMLRKFGVKTSYLDIPDTDHFSVVDKLNEPGYLLTKECIRLMGL
ncbi:kynurenine formamidase-like [Physella acuta]|uniref:kynurenine formamidase-like n=1 Tax=Physella acuta TaxID=109671 RepID=UPI0027DAEE84|nr:kynurenine formamidase-like [Physella acuta]XP_059138909.1 kynurenine formamidase-like [Physella acuta]XP_059138910.1 kynurenine formamidase-like [Physella acuta]XP_059138911.1 kynurenine formamidase-like [Physella acuta]